VEVRVGEDRFSAEVVPRGNAAAVVLDAELVERAGEGARRFPVRATINGHSWRSVVTPMGGEFLLGLSREIRGAAGIEIGEVVEVHVVRDDSPRELELPEELAASLDQDPEAAERFAALAPSHRREYARWVGSAKQPATRQRRAAQALEKIREGAPR
jgi:Bacteriocin-protection, YdeI or OmpD-Associated/Domain of unknown function (DUF1905)